MLSKLDTTNNNCDLTIFSDILETLVSLFGFVWKVEVKAKISSTCVETVGALSRVFRLFPVFSDRFPGECTKEFLLDAVNNMLQPVSQMCSSSLSLTLEEPFSIDSMNDLPLSSSWLSPEMKRVALRSFNLCVATNVSLFSGWEMDEFNVRLIRTGLVPNYFGINMSENQVTGYLSSEIESSLSQQWKLIKQILPPMFAFCFDTTLSAHQDTSDYMELKERLETAKGKHAISCYGEDKALSLLLSFSHTCLLLAIENKDTSFSRNLFLLAMSIVVPASDFCLNTTLWDCEIGHSDGSSQSNLNEWRNFDWDKDELAPSNRPGYVRPRNRPIFSCPSGSKLLHEWFGGENDIEPLSNLICLPISIMLEEWKKSNNSDQFLNAMGGNDAMERLDCCVKQLRGCFSELSVEKACLNVSSALLLVASTPECQNRFLCIQQAALFASQSAKGGTSDQVFQSQLPKSESCTALEALLIIGRAGCLQAVYFHQEAAFLCSYVASVCSLHRDKQRTDFEWDSKWRIISILTYDLSVVIRNAVTVIHQDQDRQEDTSGTWEKEVIDELKRSRSDGASWRLSLGHTISNNTNVKRKSNGSTSTSTSEVGYTVQNKNSNIKNQKITELQLKLKDQNRNIKLVSFQQNKATENIDIDTIQTAQEKSDYDFRQDDSSVEVDVVEI